MICRSVELDGAVSASRYSSMLSFCLSCIVGLGCVKFAPNTVVEFPCCWILSFSGPWDGNRQQNSNVVPMGLKRAMKSVWLLSKIWTCEFGALGFNQLFKYLLLSFLLPKLQRKSKSETTYILRNLNETRPVTPHCHWQSFVTDNFLHRSPSL